MKTPTYKIFRALYLITLFCCLCGQAKAQSSEIDIDRYLDTTISSNPINEKYDFNQMSKYLDKKEKLLNALLIKRDDLSSYLNQIDLTTFLKLQSELGSLEKNANGLYDISDLVAALEESYFYFDYKNTGNVTDRTRNKIISEINNVISEATSAKNQLKTLKANINTVSSDIESCKEAMDSALKTEDRKQKFTRTVAIAGFSVIFLIIGLFFYTMLARGKAEDVARLIGFTGLQFITLFAVIICLVIFGILSMIPGSELASILSAISGFILGKGNYERETTLQKTSQDS